jgi:hypothetical protein
MARPVQAVFPTIARQLADLMLEAEHTIAAVLDQDSSLLLQQVFKTAIRQAAIATFTEPQANSYRLGGHRACDGRSR